MYSNDNQTAIKQFWSWFECHRAEIDLLVETSDPLWDRVLDELKKINKGLWFELSRPDGDDRELIITVESNNELFELVEAIVLGAPKLAGWRIFALKPPRGFDFQTNYAGISLNPKSMRFQPLEWQDALERIGVRIGLETFSESNREAITSGVIIVLENGLGEQMFGEDIHHVEVCSLPENHEALGYFSLANLAEYVTWRKGKLGLK